MQTQMDPISRFRVSPQLRHFCLLTIICMRVHLATVSSVTFRARERHRKAWGPGGAPLHLILVLRGRPTSSAVLSVSQGCLPSCLAWNGLWTFAILECPVCVPPTPNHRSRGGTLRAGVLQQFFTEKVFNTG